jgi:hypothetical protein
MTRAAGSMTDKFVVSKKRQDKHTYSLQLECNTTTYYICICTQPESADGNFARVFLNGKIQSNNAHIEHMANWFDDNPSPSNTP